MGSEGEMSKKKNLLKMNKVKYYGNQTKMHVKRNSKVK